MEPFRAPMHLILVQQSMRKTIDEEHLEKKEAEMDQIETSLKVAMALNYLHEKLMIRKRSSDGRTRRPAMLITMQITGRALMALGRAVQLVGMRLVKLGQGSAD